MRSLFALFVWMYLLVTTLAEVAFSYVLDTSHQMLAIGLLIASQVFVVSLSFMEVRSGGRFLKYIPMTALALAAVLALALILSYGHG